MKINLVAQHPTFLHFFYSCIMGEVVIIGGGPAGATTALRLAQLGVRSTVIDKATFPRDKICGDALSGKTVEVIRKLNALWLDEIRSKEVFLGSYGVTFVAPSGEALRVPFKKDFTPGDAAPGFISRRIDFDDWLIEKVRMEPLITLVEGVACRHFERLPNGYRIQAGDNWIDASLVIAADGAQSAFAKQEGGLQKEAAHNCFGLRAYFEGVSGLDEQHFIELHFLKEFLPGYFWIFPLPGGRANVGVGMRADVISSKKIALKKSFETLITTHPQLRQRFSKARLEGTVKQFGLPLGSKKRQLSGANFLLCGDAAMLIDPFTGEGIGNAMMSGLIAAEVAASACKNANYDATFLSAYDQRVYQRLGSELQLSYRMQQLVRFPWLFNLVVRKANSNPVLKETISCMFEDIDLRERLKDPRFYFRLIFG
ncbi:MAG: geranylgeranyl reductase family protein [Chitinophagales bacterium]